MRYTTEVGKMLKRQPKFWIFLWLVLSREGVKILIFKEGWCTTIFLIKIFKISNFPPTLFPHGLCFSHVQVQKWTVKIRESRIVTNVTWIVTWRNCNLKNFQISRENARDSAKICICFSVADSRFISRRVTFLNLLILFRV